MKFDPNLRWLFTEVPMMERYEAAARAGFEGVEVAFPYDTPAPELKQILDRNGLKLVQILSPFDWDGGERGIAALPDRVADYRKSVEFAVQYACGVGRPLIHVMASNLPAGADRERHLETFVDNIGYAARIAGDEGITIILEPVCGARFPNYMYKTLAEGVDVINAVGRDNVKLCYDTYHVQMQEGSLTERLEAVFPFVGHIQLGNSPGRHEPGTGEVDLDFMIAQMERLGWDRFIGLEYAPSADTLSTLGWAKPYGLTAK